MSFKYCLICLDLLRTKEITMSIEVEANETINSGRRKRDPGDLYDFVDGDFGETDMTAFKNKVYLFDLPTI